MAWTLDSAVWLLVVVIFFPCAGCWSAPWFCHEMECPMYTLVHEYEGFEERNYNQSYWITTDTVSSNGDDVSVGFWKLYNFIQGENNEKKVIGMTRPVLVSVKEADGMDGKQVSISFYQTAPDIPKANDETIRVTVVPASTVYVRSFDGVAKYEDGLREVESLKEKLNAAGKQFIESKFDAAGYDAPWMLINRHNEVWLHALQPFTD